MRPVGKTAFLFPGQGVQYPGMGKGFYDMSGTARRVYGLAGEAAGLDVAALCFGEDERLNITEYTQIAILATEVAILKVMEERGIAADCCAGLSLGEYGALAAAEAMELPDLFRLIRSRGIYMQEAYPAGGAMTAVLGLSADAAGAVCRETPGIVSIANDNCPGQLVITGEEKAVQTAAERMLEAGARGCVPLKVSGPFHSGLMKGAGEKLAEELGRVEVRDPKIPYLCNVEAAVVTDAGRIREFLIRQVSGTVRWRESVERMVEMGVDTFIEIGPGRTLSGFVRRISRDAAVKNVETPEDLDRLLQEL